MDIARSNIVKSIAGRDAGSLFFVLATEGDFLLLADGKRRRVEDPICTLLAGCPEQPPALIHAEEKDGEIVLVTA